MNGQEIKTTPTESMVIHTEVKTNVPETKQNFLSQIKTKIPEPVKTAFNRFYSNKKVFYPVAIVGGLLLLTLIAGILFGTKAPGVTQKKPTPTPTASGQPQATTAGDILTQTELRLGGLRDVINNLDLKQSRIKPPTINFDIRF